MKSSRQVERIIGQARLRADQAFDERLLGDARGALADFTDAREHALRPDPRIWRTIMTSRVTRYSIAATFLIAASLVLFNPLDGLGGRHGVVWAQVAARVGEKRTVTHMEKRFFYEQGQDKPFLEADVRKYVSLDQGVVEEQYNGQGALMYRAYMLRQSRRFLLVLPIYKRYLDLPLDDSFGEKIDSVTPKGLVDYFMSRPYKGLGQAQLDGYQAEGFEINDASLMPIPPQFRFLAPFEGVRFRLWIDVQTSLPVGVDTEITTDRGLLTWFKRLRVTAHAYDLRWDAEIPEGTFDPVIPEDCVPLNPVSTNGTEGAH
jgi:hypothetical protein